MSDDSLLAFSRAFCDSVRSGLPPAATLQELANASFGSRKLRAASEEVNKGRALHEALAEQNLFPPVLIALIRAGEESGKLDEFLDRYATALDNRIDFRRRLVRAVTYPAFAVALGALLFVLFTTKAAPLLLEPLMTAGIAIPAGALKTIKLGDALIGNWPLLLGGVAALWVVASAAFGSRPGRQARALAGHWLPGARYVCEQARWYDLEATLELLLGAGLRPRETMEIMRQYFYDDPLTLRRLGDGAKMMADGKGFAESLAPCLPPDDRPRVAVAEKAGRLDETLGKLAKSHRELHLHRLKQSATAVQLASVVALAPMVFALTMWILWPTMAVLRSQGEQLGALAKPDSGAAPAGLSAPLPSGPSEHAEASVKASRFNEANAKGILGYMEEHAVPKKDAGDASSDASPDAPKKKKWTPPKLKTGSSMQKPQFKRIESTTIKSGLE